MTDNYLDAESGPPEHEDRLGPVQPCVPVDEEAVAGRFVADPWGRADSWFGEPELDQGAVDG